MLFRSQRGLDDALTEQVGLARWRRAQAHGLVASGDMRRSGIGVRVDSDGRHPQASCACSHPTGDFAAVGNQDFGPHGNLLGEADIVEQATGGVNARALQLRTVAGRGQ